MADKYVKLDDVINIIREVNWNLGGLVQYVQEHCPTADVVPRAEVKRLVGAYYDKCDECRNKIANAIKAEVAREIFEEIEENVLGGHFLKSWEWNEEAYAKLKKKYTEGDSE